MMPRVHIQRRRAVAVAAAVTFFAGSAGTISFVPSKSTFGFHVGQASRTEPAFSPVERPNSGAPWDEVWARASSALAACTLVLGLTLGSPAPSGAVFRVVVTQADLDRIQAEALKSKGVSSTSVPQADLDKFQADTLKSKVLDGASKEAKKKAEEAEQQVTKLTQAENLLKDLDKKKGDETQKATKELQAARKVDEGALKDLEKRAANPEEVKKNPELPKAQQLFKSFFGKKEKESKAKEETIKKENAEAAALREKLVADIEARKAQAVKAAEEAEAVAARIEELARQARATAEAAKALAK